jgi:hypothetical protein
LFEEIELLEGLQSVDSKDKGIVGSHTETVHELLELNIVEDHSGDVMGVQFGHGLVGLGLNLRGDAVSVTKDGSSDLGAQSSSMVVSLGLGVRNTEREILGDLVEISSNGSEEFSLWVFLNLSSFRSGGLVGSDVLIRDGIGSNIGESSNILNRVWVMVVVSLDGSGSGDKSAISQEFHYLI